MSKKAKIKKDQRHDEIVTKLAGLAYNHALFYLPHVGEYIKEGHKSTLDLLKKAKVKPEECTGNVLRAAHEKQEADWRQSIRDWNAKPGSIPTVLVGDPEFDPSARVAQSPADESDRKPVLPVVEKLLDASR